MENHHLAALVSELRFEFFFLSAELPDFRWLILIMSILTIDSVARFIWFV